MRALGACEVAVWANPVDAEPVALAANHCHDTLAISMPRRVSSFSGRGKSVTKKKP
jgi:hypothetical protein